MTKAEMKRLVDAKRRQYDEDLRAVMKLPAGRRFVWRLIEDTGRLFASSFTGNSTTFFNEGVRSVALKVMAEAQRVAPAEAVHMYQEQLKAKADDELSRKQADETARTEADDGYGVDSDEG